MKKKPQLLANRLKRMTRCRDISAKRVKVMYRSEKIRAWESKRCKCSFIRFFRDLSFNLTD